MSTCHRLSPVSFIFAALSLLRKQSLYITTEQAAENQIQISVAVIDNCRFLVIAGADSDEVPNFLLSRNETLSVVINNQYYYRKGRDVTEEERRRIGIRGPPRRDPGTKGGLHEAL